MLARYSYNEIRRKFILLHHPGKKNSHGISFFRRRSVEPLLLFLSSDTSFLNSTSYLVINQAKVKFLHIYFVVIVYK